MEKPIAHTPIGYFKYFYSYMGFKLIVNMFLAIIPGLLDSIGLALFIPLLQFVAEDNAPVNDQSMGGMGFMFDMFSSVGLPLNLTTILTFMVLVFSLKGFINYVLTMEQIDLRQKYMVKLRLSQVNLLRNLNYTGFLKLDMGKIQNVFTVEITKNLMGMLNFLATVKAVVSILSYLLMCFIANWQFSLLVMGGGGISALLYRKITSVIKGSSIEISRKDNVFNSYIIQSVFSFKYLKATNLYGKYSIKLRDIIGEIEGINRVLSKSQAITAGTREPVIIFIVAIVILVETTYFGVSLGSILLSLLLFYRALTGFVLVQSAWQGFMQNVGAIESVSTFARELKKDQEKFNETPISTFSDKIELSDFSFSYGNKPTLSNINLVINKNDVVAFVGESGSGKSTLANCICGLLTPQKGDLKVDGVSLYSVDVNSFRDQIGYITQEAIIYNDSLFNNVTFWSAKTEDNLKRFWNIIEKVGLTDFVKKLDSEEDTVLGDNGMMVSGGQRQRISIARELFKDIKILIMDEATSALDSQTESLIKESIDGLKGEYTLIIIAHRLSTIKNADSIVLLDQGRIVEADNFENLKQKSMQFKKMVDLQEV